MTETPTSIGRIEQALAEFGSEHEPPASWEAHVFARIAQERLDDELARLGEDHEPLPGWEDRVLAVTAARPKPRWQWAATAGFAAAAAIAIFFAIRPPPSPSPSHQPQSETFVAEAIMRPGGTGERGTSERGTDKCGSASIGHVLDARVAGGGRFRALRIYRRDTLIVQCPGDPQCGGSETDLVVALPLERPGEYVVMMLASNLPIPPSRGVYDKDIATAERFGAHMKRKEERCIVD